MNLEKGLLYFRAIRSEQFINKWIEYQKFEALINETGTRLFKKQTLQKKVSSANIDLNFQAHLPIPKLSCLQSFWYFTSPQ